MRLKLAQRIVLQEWQLRTAPARVLLGLSLPCSPQFSLPYRQVNEGLEPRCSIRAATQMIYSILRRWFGTVSELILRNSFNFNISRMIEKPKLVFNLHKTTAFSTQNYYSGKAQFYKPHYPHVCKCFKYIHYI